MLPKYMRKRRRSSREPINLEGAIKIMWITDTHIDAGVDGDAEAEGACSEFSESGVGPRCYYTGRGKLAYFVDQVNEEKPDMAIHTGDAIDGAHSDDDFQLFIDEWDRIDSSITKDFCRGNHDKNPNLISMLGYDNRDVNAGSVFNQSYSLGNEYFDIKIITINTHLQEDEEAGYIGRTQGRTYPYLVEWVKSEIEQASEDTILIFSHAGAHQPDAYFWDKHSFDFRDMVYETGKKVHMLFGHRHSGITDYNRYKTMKGLDSSQLVGHTIPTAVNQGEKSNYGVIYVTQNGDVVVELKDLLYTP